MMELTLIGVLLAVFWYLERHHTEQGFLFYRFPLLAPRGTFGSAPNPKNIMQGYSWIDFRNLIDKFKSVKNTVYLNNFRFFDHFIEKSKISEGTKKKIEKTEIYLDPYKLTQGVVIFGATGTGKSEEFYSLLVQKWYQRALIHDIKQDFIKRLYIKNRDIIYNGGLDKRSHVWNIFGEEIPVQQAFFANLLSALIGDKKDYFSQAAEKKFSDTAKALTSIYAYESTERKWTLFLTAIKDMIALMEKGQSKSDADVSKTMDQILEIFEMSAFFIIKQKRKTFLIKDFFQKDRQAKLFLSNVEAYQKALTPIFTGFIAAFTMVHASLDSYAASKGNYTAYILDEYLGFLPYLDAGTVDRIHLRLRSFGCCLISGLQKLPEKQELKDTLLSSNYLILYFGGSGKDVVESLAEKIKQTDYWYEEENISIDSKGKKNRSYSKQQRSMMLFSNDMMHSLGEKYEHIAFFPLLKTIYKGYTRKIELKEKVEGLIPTDLSEFYKLKFKDFTVREVQSFDEIFESPKLSKLEEYKLFRKYEKAKAAGDKAVEDFKTSEKLEAVNLDLLFSKFIEDKQVLNNKMKNYSVAERFELFHAYRKIKDDDAASFEFITKHDLFGALPSFFAFSEEDLGGVV